MSYFYWLEQSAYQTDIQGRSVYFPNGIFSLGRIVPDESTKAAIGRAMRPRLVALYVGLPAAHYALSLLMWPATSGAVGLATLPLMFLWFIEYELKLHSLLSPLEPSNLPWSYPRANSLKAFLFRYGGITLFLTALTVPFGPPSWEWFSRAEGSLVGFGVGIFAAEFIVRLKDLLCRWMPCERPPSEL